MSIMTRVEDRYRNDNAFHVVVDQMQRIILELHLSPSELREAAMFACYLVECRHPRPIRTGELTTNFDAGDRSPKR